MLRLGGASGYTLLDLSRLLTVSLRETVRIACLCLFVTALRPFRFPLPLGPTEVGPGREASVARVRCAAVVCICRVLPPLFSDMCVLCCLSTMS